jgi:acetyl esterase/lipase
MFWALLRKGIMKKIILAFLFWFPMLFSACVAPQETAAVPTQPSFADIMPGKAIRDVTYCSPGGSEQKLDLYFPEETHGRFPVAIYIHGGGWTSGDKSTFWGLNLTPELVRRGYLVASVNYRLAPQNHFPAMIQDIKCAVRFLRAHSQKYRLDPSRIGAWGDSAGGHLVALLGTAGPESGYDVGEYLDQSSRVQAIIDLYGPIDIPGMARTRQFDSMLVNVFGKNDPDDPGLVNASPLSHLAGKEPPFLILHGTSDMTVPISQSEKLYDQLKAAGDPAELVVVKNAGHGFEDPGREISPTQTELVQKAANFFDQVLK